MKIIFTLLFVSSILFQGCKGQPKPAPKEIFTKEFNWRIVIPEGFEVISSEQWMKMQNRGADAIKKTYGAEVENRTTTIFAFKNDQFNYFEANYQPFDTATDGNFLESVREVNKLLFGTFEAQMPGAKLDSVSSKETIDGKVFHVFRTTITIPGKIVMESLMYSRLFGNKEFTVAIFTVDKDKQKILLNALKSSKFGSR